MAIYDPAFLAAVERKRVTLPRHPWPVSEVCGHRELNADGTAYRECRRFAHHTDDHDFGLWTYPPKEHRS